MREKMEMKTNTLGVALSAGWPMALGFVFVSGVALLILPLYDELALAGFIIIGVGCAPIYPCAMHATPANFGPERSQALMGIQTASAYVGTALMPPLFGLIADHISISLLGVYLVVMLIIMIIAHQRLVKKCKHT